MDMLRARRRGVGGTSSNCTQDRAHSSASSKTRNGLGQHSRHFGAVQVRAGWSMLATPGADKVCERAWWRASGCWSKWTTTSSLPHPPENSTVGGDGRGSKRCGSGSRWMTVHLGTGLQWGRRALPGQERDCYGTWEYICRGGDSGGAGRGS